MSSNSTSLLALAGTVLGGGGIGSYVAFKKLKPEGDQIIVSAAKDLVVVQRDVISDMDKRLDEMQRRLDEAEARSGQRDREAAVAMADCNAERRELRKERDAERANNLELRSRIEVLEAEVARLREDTPPHGTTT